MLAKLKRDAKDVAITGAIFFAVLLGGALLLAGVAWEILKVVAVIKFIAWL